MAGNVAASQPSSKPAAGATAAVWQQRFNAPLLNDAFLEPCPPNTACRAAWRLKLTASVCVLWFARSDKGDLSNKMRTGLRNHLANLRVTHAACVLDCPFDDVWTVLRALDNDTRLGAALLGPGVWPPTATRASLAATLAAQLAGTDGGVAARSAILSHWAAARCTSVGVLQNEVSHLRADGWARRVFPQPPHFHDGSARARAALMAMKDGRCTSRFTVLAGWRAVSRPPAQVAALTAAAPAPTPLKLAADASQMAQTTARNAAEAKPASLAGRVAELEHALRDAARSKRSADEHIAALSSEVAVKRARLDEAVAAAATATRALDDAQTCRLCFAERREMLYQPCLHLAVCKGCSDDLVRHAGESLSIAARRKGAAAKPECPICRTEAESIIGPVFMP